MTHPEQLNSLSRNASANIATEYIRKYFENLKKETIGYRDSVWNETSDGNEKSHVNFIQFFSEDMAGTINSKTVSC